MPKITCFHDGDCPICNIEINAMKKLDREGQIAWVDIAKDQAALQRAGLTYAQTMARLHVLDEQHQLQTGVHGFLRVWKLLPYYRRLAALVESVPGLLPILDVCYRIFAYWRLPLTGKKRPTD